MLQIVTMNSSTDHDKLNHGCMNLLDPSVSHYWWSRDPILHSYNYFLKHTGANLVNELFSFCLVNRKA